MNPEGHSQRLSATRTRPQAQVQDLSSVPSLAARLRNSRVVGHDAAAHPTAHPTARPPRR